MTWSARPSMPAGHIVTATDVSAILDEIDFMSGVFAHKTADEPLASNTTFQNDDHLSLPFAASKMYTIDGKLYLEGPTAGDIKLQLTWTGTVTRLDWAATGLATTATTAEGDMLSIAQLGATTPPVAPITTGTITSNWSTIEVSGLLIASTAGVLTLQWAQATSNATNTIVKKGSWMRLHPVST